MEQLFIMYAGVTNYNENVRQAARTTGTSCLAKQLLTNVVGVLLQIQQPQGLRVVKSKPNASAILPSS